VAPNLLYRWRKLMLEGGSIAVAADDSVTGNKTVRDMEARIRELERQPGRKTMEVEILKEALDKSRAKASLCPPLVRGQWRATLLAQSLKRDDLP
jgi:transposase